MSTPYAASGSAAARLTRETKQVYYQSCSGRFSWKVLLRLAIDAHHHLWQLGRFPYRWLAPDAPPRPFGDHGPLKRNYLLSDYLADIDGAGIVGSVFVEANSDAEGAAEIEWVEEIAEPDFPQAAVGRLDLRRPDAASVLDAFCRSSRPT